MTSPRIDLRAEPLTSPVATTLILALNADLCARYPGVDPAIHFRLDPEEVAPGRGLFLVAFVDDEPLACGAVRLLDHEHAEVKRMYVDQRARRTGLARRLLAALEDEARRLGAETLLLETGARQPEAIALYESAGYARRRSYGDYEASPLSVFMSKTLESRR